MSSVERIASSGHELMARVGHESPQPQEFSVLGVVATPIQVIRNYIFDQARQTAMTVRTIKNVLLDFHGLEFFQLLEKLDHCQHSMVDLRSSIFRLLLVSQLPELSNIQQIGFNEITPVLRAVLSEKLLPRVTELIQQVCAVHDVLDDTALYRATLTNFVENMKMVVSIDLAMPNRQYVNCIENISRLTEIFRSQLSQFEDANSDSGSAVAIAKLQLTGLHQNLQGADYLFAEINRIIEIYDHCYRCDTVIAIITNLSQKILENARDIEQNPGSYSKLTTYIVKPFLNVVGGMESLPKLCGEVIMCFSGSSNVPVPGAVSANFPDSPSLHFSERGSAVAPDGSGNSSFTVSSGPHDRTVSPNKSDGGV